jgi:hypothetical protein
LRETVHLTAKDPESRGSETSAHGPFQKKRAKQMKSGLRGKADPRATRCDCRIGPITDFGRVRTRGLLKSSGAMDLAQVPTELRLAPLRLCPAGPVDRELKVRKDAARLPRHR